VKSVTRVKCVIHANLVILRAIPVTLVMVLVKHAKCVIHVKYATPPVIHVTHVKHVLHANCVIILLKYALHVIPVTIAKYAIQHHIRKLYITS